MALAMAVAVEQIVTSEGIAWQQLLQTILSSLCAMMKGCAAIAHLAAVLDQRAVDSEL